jgi:hypothetical protein
VSFPAWWTPEISDLVPRIEDVGIALFSLPINNAVLGGVHPRYWLDTDEQTQQVLFSEDEAYLRVVRLGGETDLVNNRDIHRVQFAAAHQNRDTSWDIVVFVQRVLYAYERTRYVVMPNGRKVALEFLGETLGPLLDPQQIRDARLVPFTAQLATPWPKGVAQIVTENLGD